MIRISEQNIIATTKYLRVKQNLLSLTVNTSDQYLKNGSEKTVFLPVSAMLKQDRYLRSLFAVKMATPCTNHGEFGDWRIASRSRV